MGSKEVPANNEVIRQYTSVTGALETMFAVVRERFAYENWRTDGIGTCAVDKSTAEGLLTGPAKDELIFLREQKNRKAPGEHLPDACPYHRAENGCCLGTLKSPLCISYIDYPTRFEQQFGISSSYLSLDINFILRQILTGENGPNRYIDTESNQELADLAVEAIGKMTSHIEKFPKITLEEREEARRNMVSYKDAVKNDSYLEIYEDDI